MQAAPQIPGHITVVSSSHARRTEAYGRWRVKNSRRWLRNAIVSAAAGLALGFAAGVAL